MSNSASSATGSRPRKKAASTSLSLASPTVDAAAILPTGKLPLVPCPCCGIKMTVRLVSKSSANPGRVFYKCPNHRVGPNPCNHFYWENGEDSYADFLLMNGYTVDATEEKEEENGNAGLKLDGVMQKMDELIKLCTLIVAGIVVVIAVLVTIVLAK